MSGLKAALGEPSSAGFVAALAVAATPDGTSMIALEDLSEPVRMLRVLTALDLCLATEGVWKFLMERELGASVEAAVRWSRMIGARRVASYLSAVARTFPRGKVPRDDDKRAEAVMKLGSRSPDPLHELDRRFADAEAELVVRLRQYVRKHEAELDEAIATLPRERAQAAPSRASSSSASRATKSTIQKLEAIARGSRTRKSARTAVGRKDVIARTVRTPKPSARTRPTGSAADPASPYERDRVDAFLNELESLSAAEWRRVFLEYTRNRRRTVAANQLAFGVITTVFQELGRGTRAHKAVHAQIDRTVKRRSRIVANAIELLGGEKDDPLLPKYLVGAIADALRALSYYSRMRSVRGGAAAIHRLLAPFQVVVKRIQL